MPQPSAFFSVPHDDVGALSFVEKLRGFCSFGTKGGLRCFVPGMFGLLQNQTVFVIDFRLDFWHSKR